ncbi:MAG: UTP--glucose-1-phosphate uridylyltransferase GalU [Dehalococcoidales bacterium]
MKVSKAVIIAAGWGTRFLPVTKAVPKEMLPLIDKPLIHYAVEEAVASGLTDIIIVTATGKEAIGDYFSHNSGLEAFLKYKGETGLWQRVHHLSQMADITYVRQEERLGLGHAVLTASEAVGDEPFAVILPDDIIDSRVPALKQLLAVYEQFQAGVLAVETVSPRESRKYGIINPVEVVGDTCRVSGLVEKPAPTEAPSNLGIVGRYILTPQVFAAIRYTKPGKGGEIQLTDALALLLKKQPVYALRFEGTRHDTGTPLGWLAAQVAFALKDPGLGPELKEKLRRLL